MNPFPPIVNFRLTAALDYASRGWLVFPCHSPTQSGCSCGHPACGSIGKHPRTKQGVKDATCDESTIRSWWGTWPAANVAIACGSASGIVAIDVDPRNGGNDTFDELTDAYGAMPETVAEITGGDGVHIFFKHPGRKIRNGNEKLGKGLDVKSDGGYVVVCPSLHVSGNRYVWRDGCEPQTVEVAEMPEWMLALLLEPETRKRIPNPTFARNDTGTHWLGKALAKTVDGSRNDTGHWLACQLRDNGVSESEATELMRAYQARCPQNGTPYTEREALATVRSAYSHPARSPASRGNATGTKPYRIPRGAHGYAPEPSEAMPQTPPPMGATDELAERFGKIISGEIYNAPLPWRLMEEQTQALLPGSITVVCGDPGAGKTFWVLEALQCWHEHAKEAAVFFIEKDRVFHTTRLVAQLSENSRLIDTDWVRDNPDKVSAATESHRPTLDALGKMIWSAPEARVTLESLQAWVLQMASAGKRIIVIDPVTAAAAGESRWGADDDFMLAVQKIITAHGCSLILITHPKKGNRPGAPTGHDMAAGAAYFRFADTVIWLNRPPKNKSFMVRHPLGLASKMQPRIIAVIQKCRNGRGAGEEIAYLFGGSLKFAEQGFVVKQSHGEDEEAVDPFSK